MDVCQGTKGGQFIHDQQRHLKRLTGVSNAMQAMILGHNGAFRSGLVLTNSNKASEASSPPMLRTPPNQTVIRITTPRRTGPPMSTEDDLQTSRATAIGDLFLDGQRREPICEPHDSCVLERKVVCSMSRRSRGGNTNQFSFGLIYNVNIPSTAM